MQPCPNCGELLNPDTKICPTCGSHLNWGYARDATYSAQMSDAIASGGKFVLVVCLIGLALPVILYNPLTIYWLLIKKRLFNISQPARWLAFWTSFLYTGLVITQLTMLTSSVFVLAAHAHLLTTTAIWLRIGFTTVFELEILRRFFHDRINGDGGFKRLRTAVGHFLVVWLFFAWAGDASVLLTKVATYGVTPISTTQKSSSGSSVSPNMSAQTIE